MLKGGFQVGSVPTRTLPVAIASWKVSRDRGNWKLAEQLPASGTQLIPFFLIQFFGGLLYMPDIVFFGLRGLL